MKFVAGMSAALMLATVAQADFSYTVTRKASGPMGAMAGSPQTSTYYYKGQKMKVDNGSTATIVDFDAQTITLVNNATKSYSVKSLGETSSSLDSKGIEAKIDVKDTGQKKTVNGFSASQTVLTMDVESNQSPRPMKMKMEMEIWASPDVPGASELRDFHRRNANRFPWQALAGGGNPAMQSALTDIQKKMASINGVPVQQIVRMTPSGGAATPVAPQMSAGQSAQMAQARAKLEAMAAQGGPAAAYAKQALERMPGGAPGSSAAGAPGSGAMVEITMDSSGFSAASVPDSTFAIPAGYSKGN
ncbi:MAG TPA: DUF4412 domain-containing protein [Bryobacteraceae bacterium]|nr:DUF4412 domain-containing protein [Bryobacteraceae bacterium]